MYKYKYLIIIIIILIVFITIERYCRNKNKSLYEIIHKDYYDIDFKEDIFPPEVNIIDYYKTVKKGYKKMREINIVMCGLCKDIENSLPKFIKRMNKLSKYFKQFKIVIFENDSKDDTRQILLKWESENKDVKIIKCPNNCKFGKKPAISHGVFSQDRMKMMAEFRNILLDEVWKYYSDYDYCMIIDVDMKGPISIDGIAHSFGLTNKLQWDMISAYGLAGITLTGGMLVYYDLLAYEDNNTDINKNRLDIFKILYKTSFLPRGSDPIKIKSAFAGLAIYKMSSIKNIRYTPPYNTCEHKTFHRNMIKQGYDKIYINPNMILLCGLQGGYKKLPIH